jgi:hypothetical protein
MGKGLGAIKEAADSSADMLKIKNGESKVVRILSDPAEIISVWEHTEEISGGWKTITCLGRDNCPLCKAGKKAAFKSYVVVLDAEDSRVKIFKASKKVGVQLIGLQEEYGDLRNRGYKISRTGEKFETSYQFFARDKTDFDTSKFELPDVEAMVMQLSREAILELMAGGVTTVSNSSSGGDSSTSDGASAGSKKEDDYPF